MKRVLLCLDLAGCSGQVQESGFRYVGNAHPLTQCVPCSKAKAADQRFVCFGEKP